MSQFPHKAQSEALAKGVTILTASATVFIYLLLALCDVATMYSRLGKAVKGYEFIVNSGTHSLFSGA